MAITLSLDGYGAATDGAAELQQLTIDATSEPTTTQVEGFITQFFAEIGGVMVGANYVHPTAQAGGSLAASAGNVVVKDQAYTGDLFLRVHGSGGTISGMVKFGDTFTIAGQAQRYFVKQYAEVDDSDELQFGFSPALEEDAAPSAVVTFTAGAGAARILKRLNVVGASIYTLRAAYGPEADTEQLEEERDRMMAGIANGGVVLIGADKLNEDDTIFSAELLRS